MIGGRERYLPELSSTLPDELRADFARHDLAAIALKSEESLAIQELAEKAAQDVLDAGLSAEIPNGTRIAKLIEEHGDTSLGDKITRTEAVRNMIWPERSNVFGVTRKDIARDAISKLHPDRAAGDKVASADDERLRALTKARQDNDHARAQGLYANTVAARASTSEEDDPAELELLRYKAWLALEASKGKFESAKEVERWKQSQLSQLPLRARASMLTAAHNLFVLGLGESSVDGTIRLPLHEYHEITEALEATRQAIESVNSDNFKSTSLLHGGITMFDFYMTSLVTSLENFMALQKSGHISDFAIRSFLKSDITRYLKETARALSPPLSMHRTLGSMAIFATSSPPEKVSKPLFTTKLDQDKLNNRPVYDKYDAARLNDESLFNKNHYYK